jgi:type VI secretion system secreted protein VgrG
VVVDFLEGDPDRPLVTGLVYNDEQMPHYTLPAEKTKSYIKTNSTKGGEGFNELRFEDKKDQEQIFVHAQRNMDQRVLNDSMERVISNRHLIVGNDEDEKTGDQNEMVYQDKNLNVKRNHTEHIEGNMQLMVGNGDADDPGKLDMVVEKRMTEWIGEEGYDFHLKGNRKELIDKSASLAVGGDQMQSVGGNKHVQVKGSHNQKVDGSNSLDVGMNHEQKVGIKHAVDAGQEIHLKAGMKVIIEAGVQISLVGPGGFVDIGPAGVTIQGIMVKINSGGAAGSGSGASPEAPADPAKPEDAVHATPTQPTEADDSKTGQKSSPD